MVGRLDLGDAQPSTDPAGARREPAGVAVDRRSGHDADTVQLVVQQDHAVVEHVDDGQRAAAPADGEVLRPSQQVRVATRLSAVPPLYHGPAVENSHERDPGAIVVLISVSYHQLRRETVEEDGVPRTEGAGTTEVDAAQSTTVGRKLVDASGVAHRHEQVAGARRDGQAPRRAVRLPPRPAPSATGRRQLAHVDRVGQVV